MTSIGDLGTFECRNLRIENQIGAGSFGADLFDQNLVFRVGDADHINQRIAFMVHNGQELSQEFFVDRRGFAVYHLNLIGEQSPAIRSSRGSLGDAINLGSIDFRSDDGIVDDYSSQITFAVNPGSGKLSSHEVMHVRQDNVTSNVDILAKRRLSVGSASTFSDHAVFNSMVAINSQEGGSVVFKKDEEGLLAMHGLHHGDVVAGSISAGALVSEGIGCARIRAQHVDFDSSGWTAQGSKSQLTFSNTRGGVFDVGNEQGSQFKVDMSAPVGSTTIINGDLDVAASVQCFNKVIVGDGAGGDSSVLTKHHLLSNRVHCDSLRTDSIETTGNLQVKSRDSKQCGITLSDFIHDSPHVNRDCANGNITVKNDSNSQILIADQSVRTSVRGRPVLTVARAGVTVEGDITSASLSTSHFVSTSIESTDANMTHVVATDVHSDHIVCDVLSTDVIRTSVGSIRCTPDECVDLCGFMKVSISGVETNAIDCITARVAHNLQLGKHAIVSNAGGLYVHGPTALQVKPVLNLGGASGDAQLNINAEHGQALSMHMQTGDLHFSESNGELHLSTNLHKTVISSDLAANGISCMRLNVSGMELEPSSSGLRIGQHLHIDEGGNMDVSGITCHNIDIDGSKLFRSGRDLHFSSALCESFSLELSGHQCLRIDQGGVSCSAIHGNIVSTDVLQCGTMVIDSMGVCSANNVDVDAPSMVVHGNLSCGGQFVVDSPKSIVSSLCVDSVNTRTIMHNESGDITIGKHLPGATSLHIRESTGSITIGDSDACAQPTAAFNIMTDGTHRDNMFIHSEHGDTTVALHACGGASSLIRMSTENSLFSMGVYNDTFRIGKGLVEGGTDDAIIIDENGVTTHTRGVIMPEVALQDLNERVSYRFNEINGDVHFQLQVDGGTTIFSSNIRSSAFGIGVQEPSADVHLGSQNQTTQLKLSNAANKDLVLAIDSTGDASFASSSQAYNFDGTVTCTASQTHTGSHTVTQSIQSDSFLQQTGTGETLCAYDLNTHMLGLGTPTPLSDLHIMSHDSSASIRLQNLSDSSLLALSDTGVVSLSTSGAIFRVHDDLHVDSAVHAVAYTYGGQDVVRTFMSSGNVITFADNVAHTPTASDTVPHTPTTTPVVDLVLMSMDSTSGNFGVGVADPQTTLDINSHNTTTQLTMRNSLNGMAQITSTAGGDMAFTASSTFFPFTGTVSSNTLQMSDSTVHSDWTISNGHATLISSNGSPLLSSNLTSKQLGVGVATPDADICVHSSSTNSIIKTQTSVGDTSTITLDSAGNLSFECTGLSYDFNGQVTTDVLQIADPSNTCDTFISSGRVVTMLDINSTPTISLDTTSGDVGIGTLNPAARLHINSGSTSTSLKMATSNADVCTLTCNSLGDLEITTTSGVADMDGAFVAETLRARNADATSSIDTHISSGHAITIASGDTNPAISIKLDSTNIGVGLASPSSNLHVHSNDITATSTLQCSTDTYLTTLSDTSVAFTSSTSAFDFAGTVMVDTARFVGSTTDVDSFMSVGSLITKTAGTTSVLTCLDTATGMMGVGVASPDDTMHVHSLSTSASMQLQANDDTDGNAMFFKATVQATGDTAFSNSSNTFTFTESTLDLARVLLRDSTDEAFAFISAGHHCITNQSGTLLSAIDLSSASMGVGGLPGSNLHIVSDTASAVLELQTNVAESLTMELSNSKVSFATDSNAFEFTGASVTCDESIINGASHDVSATVQSSYLRYTKVGESNAFMAVDTSNRYLGVGTDSPTDHFHLVGSSVACTQKMVSGSNDASLTLSSDSLAFSTTSQQYSFDGDIAGTSFTIGDGIDHVQSFMSVGGYVSKADGLTQPWLHLDTRENDICLGGGTSAASCNVAIDSGGAETSLIVKCGDLGPRWKCDVDNTGPTFTSSTGEHDFTGRIRVDNMSVRDSITIENNLTVVGSLNVTGGVTTVQTTDLEVEDSVVKLAVGTQEAGVEFVTGLLMEVYTPPVAPTPTSSLSSVPTSQPTYYSGLLHDPSDATFKFAKNIDDSNINTPSSWEPAKVQIDELQLGVLHMPLDGVVYLGPRDAQGSWRLQLDAGSLAFQYRGASAWVNKFVLEAGG